MTGRRPQNPDTQRKAELARIHMCAQQLGMDDDTYRALIARVSAACGHEVTSSADLTRVGRLAVIAEMQRLGAPAPPSRGRKPPRNLDRNAYMRKVGALLRAAGRTWEYADALGKRMCGVERLEFASDVSLRKIVAALSIDARRKKRLSQEVQNG